MSDVIRKPVTVFAMAPLRIGDPNQQSWDHFWHDVNQGQHMGLHGIAFDNWQVEYEPKPGEFNWEYADPIVDGCASRGMQLAPVYGPPQHSCGGNVGDSVTKKVPDWFWQEALVRLEKKYGVGKYTLQELKFRSSQGNYSNEYPSFWVTDVMMDMVERGMIAFRDHFGGRAKHFGEINLPVCAAGERRFTSYNQHDKGTDYPNQGALQCYSEIARLDFELQMIADYGSKEAVETAWGRKLDRASIMPEDQARFFRRREHIHTQWGRDLMQWYFLSAQKHTQRIVEKALQVYAAEGSPFRGVDIGVKIPGVHWRIGRQKDGQIEFGDRVAEICAGLITPGCDWFDDDDGRGYRPLIKQFKQFQGKGSDVVLHFTCLEMDDGEGKPEAQSLAGSLVRWFGEECKRQGVRVKGENALAWLLPYKQSWERMRRALRIAGGLYGGLNLLRLGDCLVADSGNFAREEFERTLKWVNENRDK